MSLLDGLGLLGNSSNNVSKGLAYNSLIDSAGNSKWTDQQWRNFGDMGGTIDANNNLALNNGTQLTNQQFENFKNLGGQIGKDGSLTFNSAGSVSRDGTGMFDWLGSDNMKGIGTIGGLAMSGLGIWNSMNAQDQAKKQWEAENNRANQIMAMNTEKYNQYKADRTRLNAGYGGN